MARFLLLEGMDLSEMRGPHPRHPWEKARALAIDRIVANANLRPRAVLDYGCGDGFVGEHVLRVSGAQELVGFDVHLSDAQCRALSGGRAQYLNQWTGAPRRAFDLCLLCDVLEHVPDDRQLLDSVGEHMASEGRLVITVPAFQALFTDHDRALRHFRRYTLHQLEHVVSRAGLELEASGYLFGSLLWTRGAAKLLEFLPPTLRRADHGIGRWERSKLLTAALETALKCDNALLLGLAARGIKLPGLSAWALCKPQAASTRPLS